MLTRHLPTNSGIAQLVLSKVLVNLRTLMTMMFSVGSGQSSGQILRTLMLILWRDGDDYGRLCRRSFLGCEKAVRTICFSFVAMPRYLRSAVHSQRVVATEVIQAVSAPTRPPVTTC